ncbi:MAG: CapA family protein [Candidatus Cryptobacteroides sp.]
MKTLKIKAFIYCLAVLSIRLVPVSSGAQEVCGRDHGAFVLKDDGLQAQLLRDRKEALKSMDGRIRRQEADTAMMVVIGDVMMHSAQIAGAETKDGTYRFDGCLDHIAGMLSEADVAVANMEFTLAGTPYTGYPCFSAPDTYAEYVADCGIDIFLTANNHILDKGSKGLVRTLEVYGKMREKRGVLYTGSGLDRSGFDSVNPLYIRLKGIKTAIINFTYGTNSAGESSIPSVFRQSERVRISEAVAKARKDGAEIIIVFPHWGTEYIHRHSSSQEKTAEWLGSLGVDLIVGAHPHVVQDIGTVVKTDAEGKENGTAQVLYSIGNAISNMSATDTQVELMVRVRVTRDADGKAIVLPVETEYLWCSLPGTFTDRHTVIPVDEYYGKKEMWKSPYDHDKMVQSTLRTARETGISWDNPREK